MQTVQQGGYGMAVRIDLPFQDAVGKVKEAFKEEGFGALSELDIQQALMEKIGERVEPYTILGMCNPRLAHRAMGLEPEIGVLLPCNVLVREEHGHVIVTAQNPSQFAQWTGNDSLEPIAQEAKASIDRALEKLASS